ncbi:iron-containing redox enzyme family protein [Acidipila sp. 4G-K13]|uniref:TENA/THI-4 protein n=2 Tax=Paracidobacterium acidisoli TaxID=2303751 RepID=A0A372IQI6_9BACT|nr:iron-containing redox enzyme family protein [Paracidobacterium acidisoli]
MDTSPTFEVSVELNAFRTELNERVAKYDLLCHPYYKAWSAGELTKNDLREYAVSYYQHVSAFPTCLAALYARLEDGALRRTVLENLADEEGMGSGRPHSELWLDFAEGMGADREAARRSGNPAIDVLMAHFREMAQKGSTAEALAAFYAYESQVPRVAKEKASGLREWYGADTRTCGYFTLHTTADIHHSNVWREELSKLVQRDPEVAEAALQSAEAAAKALWHALDGIEAQRQERLAA